MGPSHGDSRCNDLGIGTFSLFFFINKKILTSQLFLFVTSVFAVFDLWLHSKIDLQYIASSIMSKTPLEIESTILCNKFPIS